MALWKAGGKSLNKELEFRSWHCGRQGGAQVSRLGAPVSSWGASEKLLGAQVSS